MTTLINYPVDVNAEIISVPVSMRDSFVVLNADAVDVTNELLANDRIVYRSRNVHGYVTDLFMETRYAVKETYYAMSSMFNVGETPVFFANIINSVTGDRLTRADVESLSMTLYSYSGNNIYSAAGVGYNPIDGWTNIEIPVLDVLLDEPQTVPLCPFTPNFVYEPDTLADNPFKNAGNYRAIFTMTPKSGNRIPIVFNVRVS